MADVKMKELNALANELNELMGFDEDKCLPTKVGTRKVDLEEEIRKVAEMLEPDDKLTVESVETLEKMGIDVEEAKVTEVEEYKEEEVKAETEVEESKKEEGEEKKPKSKTKAKKTTKTEGKKDVDEFGFSIKSQNHFFVMAIKKKPMTMTDIKSLPWNKKGSTFYSTWKKLQSMGIGNRDEKGKMNIE